MSDSVERFGLYLSRGFLDAGECARLVEEVSAARGGPATVYRPRAASPVDERLRRTTRHMLSPETTERVRGLLLRRRDEVAEHFGLTLSDCEDPQFLRYREGDFFVAHQDGNTEQLQYDHLRVRRVSVVVFLNRQSAEPAHGAFGGGSLVFYEPHADTARKELGAPAPVEPGLLVAFRAETTHEVTPVTHGQRFAIVCWYR
ncbi:MAG TPA: 2OG-Fe(II) oxygenase [Pyrinomonadaceae bacterium]|jgi:SM-20-related protein